MYRQDKFLVILFFCIQIQDCLPFRGSCVCHAMARREIVDADGKPIMFGDILYGEDGRAWTVLGPYTKRWLFVSGVNLDGEPVKQPVMAKWMTRVPRKAEEK